MKLIKNLGIALMGCFLAIAFHSHSAAKILAFEAQNLGDRAILVDFADRVVVPTYQQLAIKTKVLYRFTKSLIQIKIFVGVQGCP